MESVRVWDEEMKRLEKRNFLTFLFDGWEDCLKRSLYGSIAAEVKQHPTVLSLDDLSGKRGNVPTLIETTQRATSTMGLSDMKKFIAATTDNPTTMQAYRRELQKLYPWLLTFACFLHGLNTIIGEISTFAKMKQVIKKVTEVVTFFNRSHYWGGQLKGEALKHGIKTSLKQNCESRWYALVLHCMSVQTYRPALIAICIREDALRPPDKLSPIPRSIYDIVVTNGNLFWPAIAQFIRTVKPLVDAIGNVESRDATLADCMLELIRCARAMTRLTLHDSDEVGFWLHSKAVFNRRFYEMDTAHHSLALFLHPLCRRLAVSQVANGRSFELMKKTALEIAQRWSWPLPRAKALKADLEAYYKCEEPFTGGDADALKWWTNLPVDAAKHPLKALARALHSIVPHAGDIERLFSDLGGTQSVKRCRLSVDTFEKLGKLRSNLSRHLHQKLALNGVPIRRKHSHMHTRPESGIDTELAADLDEDFTWVPPLTIAREPSEALEGPEDTDLDDLEKAFKEFEEELRNRDLNSEVLEGELYDFEELEKVDKNVIPVAVEEEITVLVGGEAEQGDTWTIEDV
ncbi:hypothetical protein DICSQDRAFT_145296 [Dichomitus squalens LYAD-421 SS1]|uniref:uncharacterized protein n=1 Tax=Dichomitus squalens (strain LYAD-421) TaxID=732165 RepID=UPI0004411B01|nr:uncharacterized protein DICSQDRAFT_145296 [Dichomitus squalens LYAD-421 SS1]EJF63824.1 hypothetical protein DICSQDRAFT_145296 [Dichomitus squalens LYAD-421 SS1]